MKSWHCRLLRWGSSTVADIAFADLAALEAQRNSSLNQSITHPFIPQHSGDTGTVLGFKPYSSQQNSPKPNHLASQHRSKHSAVDRSGSGVPWMDDKLAEASMLLSNIAQQEHLEPGLLQKSDHAMSQQQQEQQHAWVAADPDSPSQQHEHEQHHLQHQLPCASPAELSSPVWHDTGQGEPTRLPYEQIQRLPAMLPTSPAAAPTRSAAVGLDTLSMRPAQGHPPKLPPQGIATLRPQHNFAAVSNSTAVSSAPGHTSPSAEDNVTVAIAAQHHHGKQYYKAHHRQGHKLSPLAADKLNDYKGTLNASTAEAPVLRRRASFRKAVKDGKVQHLTYSGQPDRTANALRNSQGLLPLHHDQDQSVSSSSGSSLVHRLMSLSWHHPGQVVPESPPDVVTKVERSTHGSAADLDHFANGNLASMLQHSIHSTHGDMKKARKPIKLIIHDALRQSSAQVQACTLQLQAQLHEQSSMRQALQAMNAQTVAMLDNAIAAAVHQQLHSRPD